MSRTARNVAPVLVFLLPLPAVGQAVPSAPAPVVPVATESRPARIEGSAGDGLPGIGGVVVPIDDEPGTVRLSMHGSYFDARDFGKSGTDLTGLGSSFAVGWSPFRRLGLAFEASGTSHHGEPMVPAGVQALGDLAGSVAWAPISFGDRGGAGVRAGVRFWSGDEPFSAYGDTASVFADVLAGASAREGRIRFALNAGYVDDRGENLLPEDTVLSVPLRAAYGTAAGPHARVRLLAAAPLAGGRIEPFVALNARRWFGDVEEGDTVLAGLGVRARIGRDDRAILLDSRVDVRLLTGKEGAARPLEPPMRLWAGITFVLPPVRSGAPQIFRVEVPAPPPPPTEGGVEGLVRDARSGEPLAWVIVDVPGHTPNPILSDANGVYRVKGLPAGDLKVRVQKQGFAIAQVPVVVKAGETVTHDVTLEPAGAKTTGVFAGDVRGRDGKPVAAKITFTFGNETRTVVADAAGKASVTLPPGSFSLVVEAPGFVSQTKTLSVAAGEQTVFNFVLVPVQQ